MEGSTVGDVAVGWRAERLPENLVVEMSTSVEANQVRDLGHLFNVTHSLRLRLLLQKIVEVVDISAMVLAVMEIEGFTTHNRLESAYLIRQVLQLDATLVNRGIQAFLDQVVDHLLSQHELLIKITDI